MSKPIVKKETRKPRIIILETAADLTGNRRNATYGEPITNLSCATELKRIYREYAGHKYCPQHDDAIESVLGKIARVATGQPGHTDNYVDIAAYSAIAAEVQELA